MALGNAIGLKFTRGGNSLVLDIAYTSTQFDFEFKLPSTKSVTLNWGDGTSEEVTGQDSTLISKTSNYSGAGTYSFYVTGDVFDLTWIDINNQTFVSGDISGWSAFTDLTYIDCRGCTNISGNVSGFNALTSLTSLLLTSTSITGDISGWSALTSLTNLRFNLTSVTGDISGFNALTSLATLYAYSSGVTFDSTPAWTNPIGNLLAQSINTTGATSTMVDNMIASFSTITTPATINVAGTNDHRTSASNDDLNTLLANGNTITLNDVLGDELYTSLNAANDNATEDITAFADYSSTIDGGVQVTQAQDISEMLPLGSEQITDGDMSADTNWDVTSANWSIAAGVASYDALASSQAIKQVTGDMAAPFVAGKYYLLSFDVANGTARLNIYSSGGSVNYIGVANYTAGSHKVVFRQTISSQGIAFYAYNSGGGTSFDLDNVSVKEIEVLGSDLVTNGSFTLGADLNVSTCAERSTPYNYDTFANATATGFDAVSDGTGSTRYAGTADEINFVSGQKYTVSFDLVLNSGAAPKYAIVAIIGGASIAGASVLATAGHNVHEFTVDTNATGLLEFFNTSATDYEITNLSVKNSDTDWTKGDGWIVVDGVAKCDGTQSATANLYQLSVVDSPPTGFAYLVKYTVSNYSAGNIRSVIGGYDDRGSAVSANGTYTDLIYCDNTSNNNRLYFSASSTFVGDIDNVSVHKLTVTKEIADSTNYTGTHYVLPEAGSDLDSFIIPSDYTAESIVAQKITGEMNATTGWTAVGAAFSSVSTPVNVGEFALEIESNTTPTELARIYVDLEAAPFSITNGDVVRLEFDIRHVGTGDAWAFYLGEANDTVKEHVVDALTANTTYFTKVHYFVKTDDNQYCVVREGNPTNDGGVYLDSISVKKVTFS